MKKLLFALTALIATASMASAEVKFSGYGRFGIAYQEDRGNKEFHGDSDAIDTFAPEQRRSVNRIADRLVDFQNTSLSHFSPAIRDRIRAAIENDTNDDGSAKTSAERREYVGPPADTNISDTILASRFRMNIDGLAETDSGVQFEARIRMQADDDAKGEAGEAKLNGASFSTIYGGLRVDAGNVGGAFDNLNKYYGDEPGFAAVVNQYTGVNYSFLGYSSGGAGANAIFFNYKVGDFGFAASYDQDAKVTVKEVVAVGEYVGMISAEVPNVDRWDMSATYIFGNVTAAVAHGQNNLDESLTALTLAAAFGDLSGTLLVADDDVAGKTLNGTAYGLSATYAISAATKINFAYGNGSAESDTQMFGVGAVHDLGGGASLKGGIGQAKIGGGDGRLRADFGAHFDF